MKKITKKGASGLGELLPAVLIFVVVGIAVTIGLTIQSNVQADQVENSSAWNASADAIEGNSTLASYLPTLALVVAAGIIIAALLGMLYSKKM